jgi:hypothetical protein
MKPLNIDTSAMVRRILSILTITNVSAQGLHLTASLAR